MSTVLRGACPHEVLGLPPDADPRQVKEAFSRLYREVATDLHGAAGDDGRAAELLEAQRSMLQAPGCRHTEVPGAAGRGAGEPEVEVDPWDDCVADHGWRVPGPAPRPRQEPDDPWQSDDGPTWVADAPEPGPRWLPPDDQLDVGRRDGRRWALGWLVLAVFNLPLVPLVGAFCMLGRRGGTAGLVRVTCWLTVVWSGLFTLWVVLVAVVHALAAQFS